MESPNARGNGSGDGVGDDVGKKGGTEKGRKKENGNMFQSTAVLHEARPVSQNCNPCTPQEIFFLSGKSSQ